MYKSKCFVGYKLAALIGRMAGHLAGDGVPCARHGAGTLDLLGSSRAGAGVRLRGVYEEVLSPSRRIS